MIELHWITLALAAVILAKGFYELGKITGHSDAWLEYYNQRAQRYNDPEM